MYSAPHQASAPLNGMSGEVIDGSGTINPAALNTAGMGFGCLFMFSYLFLPLTPLAQICFSQWLNDKSPETMTRLFLMHFHFSQSS
jgi:hypothetical protein